MLNLHMSVFGAFLFAVGLDVIGGGALLSLLYALCFSPTPAGWISSRRGGEVMTFFNVRKCFHKHLGGSGVCSPEDVLICRLL